jgi:integrase
MALRFCILSRNAIKELTPGSRLTEHGIEVARLPNGDLRYAINIMVDGLRIHRVVGKESEGVRREQAERQIEQYRTEARAGRLNLPKARKAHPLFAQAAKDYLDRLGTTGGKDLKNKRRHIDTQLVPAFGKMPINRISTLAVAEYAARRSGESPIATVNRELATLSHLFNRMIDWRWLAAQDRPRISKGVETAKPITVLTDADAAALTLAAINDVDPRLHLFVAFGLNAAMRHSEILRVRYDQIDFDHRRIRIPQAKAGARDQPITPALEQLLRQQQRQEDDKAGWVFPAAERCNSPHRVSMDKSFRRAVIGAGLDQKKVTPHVMRHTAITRLVKAGVDLPTIQRISGHKTLAMVLRYTHIYGDHLDQAVAKLDQHTSTVTQELHTAAPVANDDEDLKGPLPSEGGWWTGLDSNQRTGNPGRFTVCCL